MLSFIYIYIFNTYIFLIFTELAVVTHTHLELDVNFERKVLTGKAILDIETKSATTELVSKIILLF